MTSEISGHGFNASVGAGIGSPSIVSVEQIRSAELTDEWADEPLRVLLLPSWGRQIRSSHVKIEDAYTWWPQLKTYKGGRVDLEYGPLLLADKVVLDEGAYEALRPPRLTFDAGFGSPAMEPVTSPNIIRNPY
jgi:hypothetical protein